MDDQQIIDHEPGIAVAQDQITAAQGGSRVHLDPQIALLVGQPRRRDPAKAERQLDERVAIDAVQASSSWQIRGADKSLGDDDRILVMLVDPTQVAAGDAAELGAEA